jgi:LCP family protein required for cell wall assembly
MAQYTVYKSGRHEPVRIADHPATNARRRPGAAGAGARSSAGVVKALIFVALLATAVTLGVLYGRQALGDATGTIGVAEHLRRLPAWSRYAAPVLLLLVFALATGYLAFGRRRLVKTVCLGVLAAALLAPGIAFGYVDRTLSSTGSGGSAEQRATVAGAKTALQRPLPDKPVNILLLGIDHAGPGDPGRSDSQILVRLDPQAKTISMLSVPRDLQVDIPGVGVNKINAAYSDGGVKLTIQTFEQLTGVPINHFIRIDFGGFWHLIDLLGGVYLPVDHLYSNDEGNGFQPIHVQPGYQLLKAKDALAFVRFRHDQMGDFTRMVRQQLFLRELQRQAMRWNGSWTRVVKMVRAISKLSTTDLDSLTQLLPLVDMALGLNTAHVYQTHIEGSTATINGADYVVATQSAIATAVAQFEHPLQKHAPATVGQGAGASASASPGASVSPSASASAGASGAASTAGSAASATTGPVAAAASPAEVYDWSGWHTLATQTSLTLEAPTIWPAGLGYDTAGMPFRAYTVQLPDGGHAKAAIAVGTVTGGAWDATEYWGVQALEWKDPPAIADPSATRTIAGRTYLLFSQDKSLHMVAWQENGVTYWVVNTLDDLLPNHTMMALAESCRPIVP